MDIHTQHYFYNNTCKKCMWKKRFTALENIKSHAAKSFSKSNSDTESESESDKRARALKTIRFYFDKQKARKNEA